MTARFPLGVRQALSWALGIAARDGYVSPSISAMMGGGRESGSRMSILDQHAEAAFVLNLVDRLPEPYQAAIWFRASVLPWEDMRTLAVYLVPHIVRQLPTGVHSNRAVQMALLNAAGARGNSKQAIAKVMHVSKQDGCDWTNKVSDALDALGRVAEAELERAMIERGLV